MASQAKGFATVKVHFLWVVFLPNSKTGAEDSYHDLSPISRQILIKKSISWFVSDVKANGKKSLKQNLGTNLQAPGYPAIEQSYQP